MKLFPLKDKMYKINLMLLNQILNVIVSNNKQPRKTLHHTLFCILTNSYATSLKNVFTCSRRFIFYYMNVDKLIATFIGFTLRLVLWQNQNLTGELQLVAELINHLLMINKSRISQ